MSKGESVCNAMPYETAGRVCKTVCPNLGGENPTYVGSGKCVMCICHRSKDRAKKVVMCGFTDYHDRKYRMKASCEMAYGKIE